MRTVTIVIVTALALGACASTAAARTDNHMRYVGITPTYVWIVYANRLTSSPFAMACAVKLEARVSPRYTLPAAGYFRAYSRATRRSYRMFWVLDGLRFGKYHHADIYRVDDESVHILVRM